MSQKVFLITYVTVCQDSLGQLLLCIGTELQQSHEHRWHVHVRLPDSEASANQIDGGAADGAVGRQLGAGGL